MTRAGSRALAVGKFRLGEASGHLPRSLLKPRTLDGLFGLHVNDFVRAGDGIHKKADTATVPLQGHANQVFANDPQPQATLPLRATLALHRPVIAGSSTQDTERGRSQGHAPQGGRKF